GLRVQGFEIDQPVGERGALGRSRRGHGKESGMKEKRQVPILAPAVAGHAGTPTACKEVPGRPWDAQCRESYFFRAGGTSVQCPSATSAAMPTDSPSVGCGWMVLPMSRSEERRVGNECRRWLGRER